MHFRLIGHVPCQESYVAKVPSHTWADGKGIFFRMYSSPFVPAWQFDQSPECRQSKNALLAIWRVLAVLRGWQTDFTKASAVHKGEFLDHLCVGDVDFLQ